MLVVLDTNILVSGLLSPFGPPGRLIDLIVTGTLQIAFDDRIIAEYSDVLERPTFGFPQDAIDGLLGHIRRTGVQITALPLPPEGSPDPDDLPFVEVAVTSGAPFLITGNPRHFVLAELHGVAVVGPTEFLGAFGTLA